MSQSERKEMKVHCELSDDNDKPIEEIMRRDFIKCDKKRTGFITQLELRQILFENLSLTRVETDKLIKENSVNQDSLVNYEGEFI
jgi:hypothetical protein